MAYSGLEDDDEDQQSDSRGTVSEGKTDNGHDGDSSMFDTVIGSERKEGESERYEEEGRKLQESVSGDIGTR